MIRDACLYSGLQNISVVRKTLVLDAMQSSKRPKSALILSCCVSEDISCKESPKLPVSEKLRKSGSNPGMSLVSKSADQVTTNQIWLF